MMRGSVTEAGVAVLELHRPEKRNALDWSFFRTEFPAAVQELLAHNVRCIVLVAAGASFCSGIDLSDPQLMGVFDSSQDIDPARRGFFIRQQVACMQAAVSALEQARVPVVAAVHGACIGAGVDLIAACDIRICSDDALFSIREVRIGLAADLGTLQRLPRATGNESLVRELALTGDDFDATTAHSMGLVSRVVAGGPAEVRAAAMDIARRIAGQSPVAVAGTKANLIYSRDHSIPDGLEYVATWNAFGLQTRDTQAAAVARVNKEVPAFSKL